MTRVKGGTVTRRRHNKIRKMAKGYRQLGGKSFKEASNKVALAGQHAYAHRRLKKRNMRSLWIVRLNAACRQEGWKYSEFVNALQAKNITADRKVLSELAIQVPEAFAAVLDIAKKK